MNKRRTKKFYKQELANIATLRAENNKLRNLLDQERERNEVLIRDIGSGPFPDVIGRRPPSVLARDLQFDEFYSSRRLPAVRFLFWKDVISPSPWTSRYHARLSVFGLDDPYVDPYGVGLARRVCDDLFYHFMKEGAKKGDAE